LKSEKNVLPKILGWDIGGAHVKVALASGQTVSQIQQLSCPLWKGLDELSNCIHTVSDLFDINECEHAVTMTGELVDHFPDRKQGVLGIVNEMSNILQTSKVKYYAGKEGFIDTQQALANYQKVASANWLASAHYTADKVANALFIDIGSTTTDIVAIHEHQAVYSGFTDEERLVAKELVYCGVVRTPIFAICKSALIKSIQVPIINEYFSNTADVYRLTEELAEHADLSDTLDGRDKDIMASAVRLARMFANDAKQDELSVWRDVAKQIRNLQIQMIKDACRHQFMKKNVDLKTPIVGAGVGRFLIKDIAQQLGRDYIDFETLFDVKTSSDGPSDGYSVGDCAPAAAIACLASSLESSSTLGSSHL
jgi:probable H4MPT-linked C1 transfer pathway protein